MYTNACSTMAIWSACLFQFFELQIIYLKLLLLVLLPEWRIEKDPVPGGWDGLVGRIHVASKGHTVHGLRGGPNLQLRVVVWSGRPFPPWARPPGYH